MTIIDIHTLSMILRKWKKYIWVWLQGKEMDVPGWNVHQHLGNSVGAQADTQQKVAGQANLCRTVELGVTSDGQVD
jgi:hypothetical protein